MNPCGGEVPGGTNLFREHWPELVTGCLLGLLLFGLTVWAIVFCFLQRRYAWKTRLLAGVFLGALLPAVTYNLIMLFSGPMMTDTRFQQLPPEMMRLLVGIGALVGVSYAVAQGVAVTAAGAYYSVRLRIPHFPFLRALARRARRPFVAPRLHFPWVGVLLISAAFVGYTALLLTLTNPHISPVIKSQAKSIEKIMATTESTLIVVILASLAAVVEEIIFLLFLQTQLAWWFCRLFRAGSRASGRERESAHFWAILATSALWALGHLGALEPGWVKLAQIFPMGIALGYMRRYWGAESAIVAHVLLNIGAVLVLSDLVPV